ncbi:hypothetical protein OJF2_24250 [Aquisphaera giovannonii]|uniref:FG-GAP repeat protein n=1 Tax=Aquisphaera giovannonii TaxID=406548 RepID=A0A5B9W050_9BACT|nr:FG-GAP repeat protein [Aquisphaera giovannonii]QEH33893.1 hypothetical protein OJF2_24250 [Aquisphaera giovannonii]
MRHFRVQRALRPGIALVALIAIALGVFLRRSGRRESPLPPPAGQGRIEIEAGTREQPEMDEPPVAVAEALAVGERRAVEVEGKPLIVDGFGAFPAMGDLDGDGRMDLLLGGTRGFLQVYLNVGSPGRPRLSAPVRFGEFCRDERIPIG